MKYEKGEKLGEGTFAVVYSGFAIATVKGKPSKTKVAIKRIKMKDFQNGLDLSAIREIKYLSEIDHPNIIKLMDVFTINQSLQLVLEFLDADLEMLIKNKNIVFSSADIKSWMIMLLRGLFHCHSMDFLHRDLKPSNLLLASNGELKIADFGLARIMGDPRIPMTNQVVTRWYRAPELLLGAKHYSFGVDIWATGCIFAELMLRTPYFAAETDLAQLNMIFQALGTPTDKEWPGISFLPDYHPFTLHSKVPLNQIFTAASKDALDLLEAMLLYNPMTRISAIQAIEHEYFMCDPKPTIPYKLPKHQVQRKRKLDGQEDENLSKISRKLF